MGTKKKIIETLRKEKTIMIYYALALLLAGLLIYVDIRDKKIYSALFTGFLALWVTYGAYTLLRKTYKNLDNQNESS